jgi:hypothetical protein
VSAPRRTAKQMQGAYLRAYELYKRMPARKVAEEMAGPPDFCGGHTTARRWIAAGRALVEMVEDEQGNAIRDPSRRRPVRRDYVADELDELRAKIEEEVDSGLLPGQRLEMRKLQFQILMGTIQVEGLRRAPELPGVKRADGSKTPPSPVELLHGLAAMQPELDALIDRMLPDGRTDP